MQTTIKNKETTMMNDVFFQPFVGKDYLSSGIFGHRIMVLGESHYCEEGCKD
jgi:hypothetical protein